MNSSKTIKFGAKFREAMGFVTETGSLGKITGVIVVLLLLCKIFYYMEVGKLIQTLMNYTPERLIQALMSVDGMSNIINSADSLRLAITQVVNVHLGFGLIGVYAVLYLYFKRHPGSKLPKASPGYYLYMVFSILMTTIIFLVGYYLSMGVFPLLMLLIWPLMVYTFCSRAEFGGSSMLAMNRAHQDMREYVWKSIGYTALLMLIIYGFAIALSTLLVALLPAQGVKSMTIIYLLADVLFTLVHTRMFVAIYAENVEKPIVPEEEE